MKQFINRFFFLIILLFFNLNLISKNGIYNVTQISPTVKANGVGDNVIRVVLCKILSLKYNIPFYYDSFLHSDLFVFDSREQRLPNKNTFLKQIAAITEKNILDNMREKNILFFAQLNTKIDYINPEWISEIKKGLQLKQIPNVKQLPKDKISVAVHIRKGNGGGEFYDGEQSSIQIFNYDRSIVKYLKIDNYAFDWQEYIRKDDQVKTINQKKYKDQQRQNKNTVDGNFYWETKFPPEQFYIDQIKKVSEIYDNLPIFVQIFTDDKNPVL